LKILKRIYESGGKTFLSSELFKTRKVLTYTKRIPLGWYDYPEKGETYDINFNKTKRILILGQTGCGKSWITRAITNRATLAGLNCVYFDDAPEYWTSSLPLQEEFKKFILPIEEPTTFPIKLYYPYFLYKFVGANLPNQIIFQYNLRDLHPSDLLAFINYDQLSFSARLEVEDLISKLTVEKYKFENVDELINYILAKNISTSTKRVLVKSFRNLKNLGVFGDEYERETIIEDINNNLIPDLNLFGWKLLDFKIYVGIYISLIIRKLLSARLLQLIPENRHLLLIFEELHEFAPKRTTNYAQIITKKAIRDVVFTGRKEKISLIFITQSPEAIDPAIIEQCDLVLIPKGFERYKLMELVKNYLPDYYTYPYEFGIRMSEYLSTLRRWKDGARDWLVLERSGEMVRITPLGPLSLHRTEDFHIGDIGGRVVGGEEYG
jgi:DNA helicase HerA-like ATPase